eukprot:5735748-Prymnesium_polylepis.1
MGMQTSAPPRRPPPAPLKSPHNSSPHAAAHEPAGRSRRRAALPPPCPRADKKGVKSTIDADESRKQRASKGVELRKAKRDEGLLKRRNLVTIEPLLSDGEDAPPPPAQSELSSYATRALGFVARNGQAEELEDALGAVRALRKLLSIPNCPPIDD